MPLIFILLYGIAGASIGALLLGLFHFVFHGELDHIIKFFIPGLFWPSLAYGYYKHRSKNITKSLNLDLITALWISIYGIIGALSAIILCLPIAFLSDDPNIGFAFVAIIPAIGFWIGVIYKIARLVIKKIRSNKPTP